MTSLFGLERFIEVEDKIKDVPLDSAVDHSCLSGKTFRTEEDIFSCYDSIKYQRVSLYKGYFEVIWKFELIQLFHRLKFESVLI